MKTAFSAILCFLLAFLQPGLLQAQWQFARSAGGSQPDAGNSIATAPDGSVYVGGTFSSASITFGSYTLTNDSDGTSDIFLVKYDSAGNVLWARREGGKGDDFLQAVAADNGGNVFITGNFTSPSVAFDTFLYYSHYSCPRFYLAKYTGAGTLSWAHSYDTAYNNIGCGESYSRAITTDPHGFIYCSVYFVGTIVFGHDTFRTSLYDRYESLVMKYDNAGNLLREKQIYSEPYTFAVVGSIAADSNGNIYASGMTNGSKLYVPPLSAIGGPAAGAHFLVKLDSSGNGRYIKKMYSAACCDYIDYAVAAGSGNEVYLTGYFGNASNSKIVFGTVTLNNFSPGTSDIFLAKFDSTCNIVWAKQAGGNNDDIATSIAVSKSGTIYIAGSTKSDTAAFGTKKIINTAVDNLFFAAYDSSGNVQYVKTTDGYSNNTATSIAAANDSAVYLTGSFYSDSIQFGVWHMYNTTAGTTDFFMARYSGNGTEMAPLVAANRNMTVYPNPVGTPGYLNVILRPGSGGADALLYNSLGQCVYVISTAGNNDRLRLYLPELPKGFYYLQVNSAAGSYFIPVIISQ